jgi:hypothetical protein
MPVAKFVEQLLIRVSNESDNCDVINVRCRYCKVVVGIALCAVIVLCDGRSESSFLQEQKFMISP